MCRNNRRDQLQDPGVPGVLLEQVMFAAQFPQEKPQLSVPQLRMAEQAVRGTQEETTERH